MRVSIFLVFSLIFSLSGGINASVISGPKRIPHLKLVKTSKFYEILRLSKLNSKKLDWNYKSSVMVDVYETRAGIIYMQKPDTNSKFAINLFPGQRFYSFESGPMIRSRNNRFFALTEDNLEVEIPKIKTKVTSLDQWKREDVIGFYLYREEAGSLAVIAIPKRMKQSMIDKPIIAEKDALKRLSLQLEENENLLTAFIDYNKNRPDTFLLYVVSDIGTPELRVQVSDLSFDGKYLQIENTRPSSKIKLTRSDYGLDQPKLKTSSENTSFDIVD